MLGADTALGCPRCGRATLITGARGWGCARWREGCHYVVWFEADGKRVSLAQLRKIVARAAPPAAR